MIVMSEGVFSSCLLLCEDHDWTGERLDFRLLLLLQVFFGSFLSPV